MQRTKTNKQADAVLTADFHLREENKTPVCRTDNFWETQWKKIKYISDLQKQHDCPVLHAGDLFDHWKPSPQLLSVTIDYLPDQFYTVLGNHDLPQHNIDLIEKCGVNVLQKAGSLKVLDDVHFGDLPHQTESVSYITKGRGILVWHIYTYLAKTWPGNTAPKAPKLLKQYPEYDLILTGDNHQAFTYELEGRLLVNPGSIFRMDADQIDFSPRVYLYYADTNTVEPHYLPIDKHAVTRTHIEDKEKRDQRIDAFISRLDIEFEGTVSFEKNLEMFYQNNTVHRDIKEIVTKAIDNEY